MLRWRMKGKISDLNSLRNYCLSSNFYVNDIQIKVNFSFILNAGLCYDKKLFFALTMVKSSTGEKEIGLKF